MTGDEIDRRFNDLSIPSASFPSLILAHLLPFMNYSKGYSKYEDEVISMLSHSPIDDAKRPSEDAEVLKAIEVRNYFNDINNNSKSKVMPERGQFVPGQFE